jgi:plasmid stability protein
MADLLIRDLEPMIEQELKKRAKETGQSLSKVAQSILKRGILPETPRRGFGTELRNLVAPIGFVDLEIPRDGKTRPPPDFS